MLTRTATSSFNSTRCWGLVALFTLGLQATLGLTSASTAQAAETTAKTQSSASAEASAKPAAPPAPAGNPAVSAETTANSAKGETPTAEAPIADEWGPAGEHWTDEESAKATAEASRRYREGDYAGAAALYSRLCEKLKPGTEPSAKTLYDYALALDFARDSSAALAQYENVLGAEDLNKLNDTERDLARDRATALRKLPATVNLVGLPANARILVDGRIEEAPGGRLNLSIGSHKLTFEAEGFTSKELELVAKPAETLSVDAALVELVKEEALPGKDAEEEKEPEVVIETEPDYIPGIVTSSVAAVALGFGTAFGIAALDAESNYNASPTEDGADNTERLALMADMSFGIGITLGITGLVLLLSPPEKVVPAKTAKKGNGLFADMTFDVLPYAGPTGGGGAARLKF